MVRVEKTEDTPKKRPSEWTEYGIASKEATTKSGRKVKRPAHLASPERSPDAPAAQGRKSVARKLKTAPEAVDSPVKGTPKRRALAKPDDTVDEGKGSRKTIRSARKTVASLTDTPKKGGEKEVDAKQHQPDAVDDGGISKSGRKIKVPVKLIDFESEILTSPRKGVNVVEETKAAPQTSAKTPGRPSRSVKKQTTDEDDTESRLDDGRLPSRTARVKSLAAKEGGHSTPRKTADSDSEPTLSRTVSPAPVPPKTPGRRAKSLAPAKAAETAQQKDSSDGTSKTTGTPRLPTVMKMRASSPEISPKLLDRKTALPKPVDTEAKKEDLNSAPQTGRIPERTAVSSLTKLRVDSPAVSLKPGVRMGRSLAPSAAAGEELTRVGKTPGRTPGRRGVTSLMPSVSISSVANEQVQADRSDALLEPLSRSGRKLKPKKIFEIEQEETSSKQPQQQGDGGKEAIGADGKKRMLENVDDSTNRVVDMILPRKNKTTSDAQPSEPDQSVSQAKRKADIDAEDPFPEKLVLKKPAKKIENTAKVTTVTSSPVTAAALAGDAEGIVSRSGRKIKVKKMFGFDDGDASDSSIGHVTSPAKASTVKSPKEKPMSMVALEKESESKEVPKDPPKPVAKEIDSTAKEKVAAKKGTQLDNFVTQRGVDDHHRKAHHVAVDEPDRAIQAAFHIPEIVVPSPVEKKTSPAKSDSLVNITDGSVGISAEMVGSSRSGRKIKPKKFFDDEVNVNVTGGTIESTRGRKKSIPVAPVVVADELLADKAPSTEEPPTEEETNVRSAVAVLDEPETVGDMDNYVGVDVAEGPAVLPSAPVENAPVVESNITESSIAKETDMQPTEKVEGEKVVPEPDGKEQEEMHVAEGTTEPAQHKEQEGMDVAEGPIEPALDEKGILQSGIATVFDGPTNSDKIDNFQEQSSDTDVRCTGEPTEEENTVLGHVSNVDSKKLAAEDNSAVLDENVAKQKEDTGTDDGDAAVVASASGGSSVLQKHDVSGESTIEELKVDEDDLLAGSFGEIEYLEDEEPNVVEHIRRPPSRTVSEERAATAPAPSINIIQPTPGATAPRTPEAKAGGRDAGTKCSPDKPPEVIEIFDSPAAMAFCQQIDDAADHAAVACGGSATSTPLPTKAMLAEEACPLKERVIAKLLHEGRKRSLSASAADVTTKRNVTFHSPANSTVLVDAIDERLMAKGFQQKEKSATKKGGPRKRSLSEHKPSHEAPKPSKISRKMPNFKNIHANFFGQMESIAEFMKRKEDRAKVILTAASPATKLLSRPAGTAVAETVVGKSTEKKATAQKPFVFKSGGGSVALFGKAPTSSGIPQSRPKGSHIARPVLTAASRAAAMAAKQKAAAVAGHATDARMANRLQQYQAAFKPKAHAPDEQPSTAMNATSSSTQRPVEQLRLKQSKLLKGVRTNRRFELQMKHRDNIQHP